MTQEDEAHRTGTASYKTKMQNPVIHDFVILLFVYFDILFVVLSKELAELLKDKCKPGQADRNTVEAHTGTAGGKLEN